jgi:uncharacterized C2H2 Zn-finger protein
MKNVDNISEYIKSYTQHKNNAEVCKGRPKEFGQKKSYSFK